MAATSAGAVKAIIEGAGLGLAAYRDAMPDLTKLPTVTIDELVSVIPERHGDAFQPNGHHGEIEDLRVHLWQRWRGADGRPAETYALTRQLVRALRTAPPFAYGTPGSLVRVWGLRVSGHARIVEDEDNVVHTALTVTMRRDA